MHRSQEKALDLTGNQEWSKHRSWVLTARLQGEEGEDSMVHGDMERQYCTLMGPSNYPAWSLLETYFICFCKRRYLQPMLSKVTCIPKFHMERLFPCESLPSKVFCFTGSIGEFSVIREVRRRQHIFSNVYSTLQFQPETQGLYLLLAFNPSPDGLDDHYLGRSVAVFTVSHTYACFW